MRRKSTILISAVACALPLLAVAAGSARADSVTSIPQLSGFRQMLVDTQASPGYIFLSGGGSIVVTDLSGTFVTTLESGDGVQGIALSTDGTTLYAALTQGSAPDTIAAITVSSITPSTAPTQASYQLPAGDAPDSLAVQSGKLWVSYNDGSSGANVIGDIDLTTTTFEPQTASSGTWTSPPDLAADPSDSGVLVAVLPNANPTPAATFDTTQDPAKVIAAQASLGGNDTSSLCVKEHQIAVMPGGAQFIAACDGTQGEYVYDKTNVFSDRGVVLTGSDSPVGVAVDADGTVAAGTNGTGSQVRVETGNGTLLNAFTMTGSLAAKGLAWEDTQPGPAVLVAVEQPAGSSAYSLQVFDQPKVTRSVLSLSIQGVAVLGHAVDIGGSLTLLNNVAPPPAGVTVTITRSGPDGDNVPVGSPTTAPDGTFGLTDTPSVTGTYTYTASYAGTAQITAATVSATVKIGLDTSFLDLAGPTSVLVGKSVTVTGSLSFGFAPVPPGTKITVTRTVSGSPAGTPLPTVLTGTRGTFKFTDTPPATGTYTYTANFGGNSTTVPATKAHVVSVVRIPATLTVTANGVNFGYQSTVRVRAHLGVTYRNRTVSIYARRLGTTGAALLKSGRVDSRGDLTVSYRAAHSTTFIVKFSGDARYAPRTVTRSVYVRARVTEAVRGNYSSRVIGGVTYKLFHSTGTLADAGTVAPDKHGECVQFETQEFFQGAWHPNETTTCATLDKASQGFLTASLLQADIGYPYRIRVDYIRNPRDISNQNADSGWQYFMVAT